MERRRRAIHLRTGDRGTDGAISSWLERHGVEVIDCADPYEACTYALTRRKPPPDLAFVGADWLAPPEFAIIGYFRETWPGLATVVYGNPRITAGVQADPLTLVCRSASAVQRLLADSPDALLAGPIGLSRSPTPLDDDWRPQPAAPPPDNPGLGARDTSLQRPTMPAHNADSPAAEPAPRVSGQSPHEATGKRASVTRDILTEEELAALLDDGEH